MISRPHTFGIALLLTLFTAFDASAEYFLPKDYDATKGITLFKESTRDGYLELKPTEKGRAIIEWIVRELLVVRPEMNLQDRKKYFSDEKAWKDYQRYVTHHCERNKALCLTPDHTLHSSGSLNAFKIYSDPLNSSGNNIIYSAIGNFEIHNYDTSTTTDEMFHLYIVFTIDKPYDIEHLKIMDWNATIYRQVGAPY